MLNLFEALMIIAFAISWPVSIYKSYTSRTAKGKSLFFEVFIWFGYVFGIIRKILQIIYENEFGGLFWLAFVVYIITITLVTTDILLYFRNTKLDKLAERESVQ
ncbi:MAG: hypothetical protein E7242_03845 [Lachnospiraceae bacterium]|nr:hypothetical protein [Lachnospiraceae bacterium]